MNSRQVLLVGGPSDGTSLETTAPYRIVLAHAGPEWDETQPLPVVQYDAETPTRFVYSGAYSV